MTYHTGIVGRHTSYPITQEQHQAIHADSPTVVVQGCPGSGKSAILCSHIRWLTTPENRTQSVLAKHHQILGVAFTQRAAQEIAVRLHKSDPTAGWNYATEDDKNAPFLNTHHTFLLRLINDYKTLLGYAPSHDRIRFVAEDEQRAILSRERGTAASSRSQGRSTWDTDLGDEAQDRLEQQALRKGWTYYAKMVRDVNYLLTQDQVLTNLQNRQLFLLIDEAQDLGPAEADIYSRIPTKQTYIVGDSAQSIYQFHDNGTSLLFTFLQKPNIQTCYLSHNFRSLPNICFAATQLIANHRPEIEQPPMTPVREASNPTAPTVIQWECTTTQSQNDTLIKIARYYSEILRGQNQWSEIAVITQNKTQEQDVAAAFIRARIPYHIETSKEHGMESNAINLVRITQCKGLAYPNVVIPFMTTTNWPGKSDPNLRRRQLYTAMTRAENTVHLIFQQATHRQLREETGQPLTTNRENNLAIRGSSYLDEMNRPRFLVDCRDATPPTT